MKEKITKEKEYEIRYTEMGDREWLKKWVTDRENLKWFPMEGEKEVDLLVNNWIGFSRYRSSLTALYKGAPIGMGTLFLMPYKKTAHLATCYLVIDRSMQNKGVGRSLVRNLKHLAKTQFQLEAIYFELMEDSPLLPLLLDEGFKTIVEQKGFYYRKEESIGRVVAQVSLNEEEKNG